MKVAITGGHGFLGWHTACRLRARHGIEPVRLGRPELASPERLMQALDGVDTVLHLAGINRADTDQAVEQGNLDLAAMLAAGVMRGGRPLDVVFANSIQAELDNSYGRGKRGAAEALAAAVDAQGGRFADLLLPNLFGEHARPSYNSFVATFAHRVAHGEQPEVRDDKPVSLLHAQGAAAALIEAVGSTGEQRPVGDSHLVSEVLERLRAMHALYAEKGEIPRLASGFDIDLFNTYRSYLFPEQFPIHPVVHGDPRGDLMEVMRSHGGTGQSYVSTTRPGQVRGEHYHLHKVERFFVLRGEAEIQLRRLLHDEVVTLRLSGDRPGFVDMPTMWVHNIRNIGDTELITLFWSDQLLDPQNPDQFPELVEATW